MASAAPCPAVPAPVIVVHNRYHGAPPHGMLAVAVTRPSVLGNPFSHQEGTAARWKVATREEAVAAFKPWLKHAMRHDGPQLAELRRLAALAQTQPLALVCVCAPKACHADVIAEAVRFLCAHPDWQPTPVAAAPRGCSDLFSSPIVAIAYNLHFVPLLQDSSSATYCGISA